MTTVAVKTRERATLKTRITTSDNVLSQGKIDKVNAKLRLARLTEVFKEYEALNDELALLDRRNDGLGQMDDIQDSYYAIASKVEGMFDAHSSTSTAHCTSQVIQGVPLANSTIIEKQRLLKLPVAHLTKFDGNYDKWLLFKNTFLAMIESRTDVDDLNKFLYLRGSLTGPAFNKLALYSASAENYTRAWDLLVENYEKKRILIAKHYDVLIDIASPSRATKEGLNKIVDEARQHVNILKTLGSRSTDGLVVRLLERKLPAEIRKKWEETLAFNVFPSLEQFCKFVSESAFRISSFDQGKPFDNGRSFPRKRHAGHGPIVPKSRRTDAGARALVTSTFFACVHCKGNHSLHKCPAFISLSINQRVDVVRSKRLCRNCLREHKEPCHSMRCRLCNNFHHTLLDFKISNHPNVSRQNTPRVTPADDRPTKLLTSYALSTISRAPRSQLIMSALIQVRDSNERFIQARALLDTCATANFVTEELARKLSLPKNKCSIPIGAVNELQTFSKHLVQIFCTSMNSQFQRSLPFVTVSRIADLVSNEIFPRNLISLPANGKLADPQFHLPRAVDILIGSGTTLSLLSVGQINLSRNNGDLLLQKTQLGWVIAGGIDNMSEGQGASCHLTDLSSQLSRVWVIEDAGSTSSRSFEESMCEEHYQTHTTRDASGRYMVRLTFRTHNVDFGDSKSRALRHFLSLQRRLNSDPHLKSEYFKVMQEYVDLGHMNYVPDESQPGYYMPHHPVVKASSNTTKVRVVFDASAKTDKGNSSNNTLLVGPTIQDKLFIHLLRFRTHTYVLTADIARMYRQVFIHPDDRRFQRILWYHNKNISTFELNKVTFGVSSAPYSATRSIVQLANDEGSKFPTASRILKRDLYVDNLLTGTDSLAEVLAMRDEIITLLRCGGFDIRQWASNHHHALDNFDERTLDLDCAIDENPVSKTLGVVWNSHSDNFMYTVGPIDSSSKVTKRNILSSIAKIFDPLGLLGPVVLAAKVVIQECWKHKIDWDESVPQELRHR